MALFPIYGHFEGDFVPHLVPIDTDQTIAEISEAVAAHSVGRRVFARPDVPYETLIAGRVVSPEAKFGEIMGDLGIRPLDFVTVRFADRTDN